MTKTSLVFLRKKNKMSQRQLGELINKSEPAISMYETGSRTPSLKTAQAIANVFGVRIDEIEFKSEWIKP